MAIITLCLNMKSNKTDPMPYNTREWSAIAQKLLMLNLQPKDLFDSTSLRIISFMEEFNIERFNYLINRGNKIASELNYYSQIGLNILTRASLGYSKKLKSKLGKDCPPILFAIGNLSLLKTEGVAMVGSRTISDEEVHLTEKIALKVVSAKRTIISGGAKGVDNHSELIAMQNGGKVISIVSEGLLKRLKSEFIRENILNGSLLLISPYGPDAHFSVANAMARNKFIYALSDHSFIIKSTYKKGGTWTGAVEANKKKLSKLLVIEDPEDNSGNLELAKQFELAIIPRNIALNDAYDFSDMLGLKHNDLMVAEKKENYELMRFDF